MTSAKFSYSVAYRNQLILFLLFSFFATPFPHLVRTSYKYGPKGSPRKSPKKTPRKRKAPELVKVPKAIATDEEPGTSSGKCHTTYSQHGLHYIDRGWDCQNYNCRRLSLYPMIFSVRRSFLEPRNCHCRQLSLTDDDLYLARYLMLIICFSVISFRHQQLHEQRGFWLSVRL